MIEFKCVFALDTKGQGGVADIPVPVTCKYDPEQPYEVNLTFHVAGGNNTWTFGRELLLDGLQRSRQAPAGEGDIKSFTEDDKYYIDLKSPEGTALIFTELGVIDTFVGAMFTMVPAGEEVIDLDKELRAFMEG